MKQVRLAIVGFGKIGKACADAIRATGDLALTGIVHGPAGHDEPLPDGLRQIPAWTQISHVRDVNVALVCLPSDHVVPAAHDCLQHGIAVVDSVRLHGSAFHRHREAIHRIALRYRLPAVVGAGWDPGLASVLRTLFAVVTPGGHTETTYHTGIHLRHAVIPEVPGVKEALSTEIRTAEGKRQRLLYVQVNEGVDRDRVVKAIQVDPLFQDTEILVFPVENIAGLEEEGRGVVLERRGAPRQTGHHQFLLETRFEEAPLTAQVMIAAARALPRLEPGAYSLCDVPPSALWGDQSDKAEREWL